MLTDEDIRKLIAVFATKEEVKQQIEKLEEKVSTKEQLNEVMNRLDKVFGELKTIREEQVAHQSQHDIVNQRLDDIESLPAVAHNLKKPPQ